MCAVNGPEDDLCFSVMSSLAGLQKNMARDVNEAGSTEDLRTKTLAREHLLAPWAL